MDEIIQNGQSNQKGREEAESKETMNKHNELKTVTNTVYINHRLLTHLYQ